jgi:hypothetical protein
MYYATMGMGLRPYARSLRELRDDSRFTAPSRRSVNKVTRTLHDADKRIAAYQKWIEDQRSEELRRSELSRRIARTERYERALSVSERMRSKIQQALDELGGFAER